MPELTTQVETLSEDIFSQLMGETPSGTVNADNLIGSTKSEQTKEQPNTKETKEVKDTKTKEKVEEKVEEDKQLSQEELDKQMNAALDFEDDKDETTQDKGEKRTPGRPSKEKIDKEASQSILKTQAELLIESGLWAEFEGIEEFEWTNENYAGLVQQQAAWKAQDMFEELIDSTGPYGQAIITHVRNGGDGSEIIELFREAKKIENFDTTTEEGKVALLTKYYKDQGWSDKKTKRIIDSAIDNESLDEDVAEAKNEMEEAIKEEVKTKQKAQEEYLTEQKRLQEDFSNNITGALRDRKDIPNDQKKDIYTSLLVYDKKLPDGRVVNQFTLDFAKLQQDPKKYIDLVMFVRDYDKFKENIAKQEEKRAVKKTWDFTKGNGAINKNATSTHTKSTGKDNSDLVIDWKSANY